jgi:hypothetical protein
LATEAVDGRGLPEDVLGKSARQAHGRQSPPQRQRSVAVRGTAKALSLEDKS